MNFHWRTLFALAGLLLTASNLSAQFSELPPGLYFQLDPRTQDLKQLQSGIKPLQAPILSAPMEGEAINAPNNMPAVLTFRWTLPATSGLAESYRVCVFEATKTCEQPGSELYTVAGSVLEFTPAPGLPAAKFLGKTLKWSVSACRLAPVQQQPAAPGIAPMTKLPLQCGPSGTRTLLWPLPSPTRAGISRSPGSEPAVPQYTFYWTAVAGAKAYLFCLYAGSPDECGIRTTLQNSDPLIVDKGGTEYVIDYDLPQFRGKTVRWRVAACTHFRVEDLPTSPLPDEFRCTYQQGPGGFESVRIENPLLPPVLNPVQAVNAPANVQPLVRMSWSLPRQQDVRSVKVCVLTARGPGGTPVRPEDRATMLSHTTAYSCEQRNVLQNPLRPRNTVACTFVRPHLDTGDPNLTVFGFAVAACNEFNQCWYSPLAQVRDQFRPFGPIARCD